MKRAVGAFEFLCLLDQVDNAGDRVVGGGMCEPDTQRAMAVDASGIDEVAGALRDRHGLAGDRRLVDLRLPIDDVTIGRYSVARAHQDNIADLELLHWNLANLTVLLDPSHARHNVDQCLDTSSRSRSRNAFKQFADGEQKDDYGRLCGRSDRNRPRPSRAS